MSSHKRRHHQCVNHRHNKAKGRCSRCGKWICSECALLYKSSLYCATTCRPPRITSASLPLITKPLEPQHSGLPVHVLLTWSALTLALCGVVFGAWALRELYYSKKEITALQKNHEILTTKLENRNSRIHSLRTELVSQERARASSKILMPEPEKLLPNIPLPLKKRKIPAASEPERLLLENGFPLNFNNGPTDKKLVSLTFDGGSSANAARDILDTLRSRDVKSTMFITGQFIRKFPDLVAKITVEGHELGNHTLSHPHFTRWSQDRTHTLLPEINREFISKQLQGAQDLLFKKTGQYFAPLWRVPYGDLNRTLFRWALENGYMHVGWRQGRTWSQGLDSNDWITHDSTPGYKSPQEVMDKILALSETKPYGINGGIVLMHLGTERAQRKDQVHFIVGALIDSLRYRGYQIVPVSEMIRQSGFDLALLSSKTHIPETAITKRIKTDEP